MGHDDCFWSVCCPRILCLGLVEFLSHGATRSLTATIVTILGGTLLIVSRSMVGRFSLTVVILSRERDVVIVATLWLLCSWVHAILMLSREVIWLVRGDWLFRVRLSLGVTHLVWVADRLADIGTLDVPRGFVPVSEPLLYLLLLRP